MTLKEFFDTCNINSKDFAAACEIPYGTLWTYASRHRTPNLRNSIKMILQSGGLVTMEDLLRKDQPLMRIDNPTQKWERRHKLKKRSKYKVKANLKEHHKKRTHYRQAYYKVVDQL